MTHDIIITKEYLRANPNHIFVFGDNKLRKGRGGAASLRDEPNTHGFITKKAPNNDNDSFFTTHDYFDTLNREVLILIGKIINNPDKTYLISKLGGGLANRYRIFELLIKPILINSLKFNNVVFLWSIY